ncbi:MAG: hypothetical protein ABI440_05025 [Casimicrobiaceae bacterium]
MIAPAIAALARGSARRNTKAISGPIIRRSIQENATPVGNTALDDVDQLCNVIWNGIGFGTSAYVTYSQDLRAARQSEVFELLENVLGNIQGASRHNNS